jgi:formylglycine-generating enzyme
MHKPYAAPVIATAILAMILTGAAGAAELAPLCDIPAGTYLIGDAFDDFPDARPVHAVTLSAFKMDKYEVSKELWDEVYAWAFTNGYEFTRQACGYKYELQLAIKHPLHSLDWYYMARWCNARSEKEGLTPAYYTDASHKTVYKAGPFDLKNENVKWDANGYRLPTEAEWEAAARGGLQGQRYPWGDELQKENANFKGSEDGHEGGILVSGEPLSFTTPVGYYSGRQKPKGPDMANGYGLYDMCGNVWEYCWDRYDEQYYSASPKINPRGPDTGEARVARGGSWNDEAESKLLGCAYRLPLPPITNGRHIGFRCVRAAQPQP